MLTKYAERFVLKSCSQGLYLGVDATSSQIEVRDSVEDAWVFHTHEGAVTHARWIGEVHGETPDGETGRLTLQRSPSRSFHVKNMDGSHKPMACRPWGAVA